MGFLGFGLFFEFGRIVLSDVVAFLTARRNFLFLDPIATFTLAGCRGLWNQGLRVIGSGFGFLNCGENAIPIPNRHHP